MMNSFTGIALKTLANSKTIVGSRFWVTPLAATLLLLAQSVSATPKPEPAIEFSNLKQADSKFFDQVLLADGIDLKSYKNIYIEIAEVTFNKYWLRDHRTDVADSYKELIKDRYGKLLQEQLAKAYSETATFTVVENKEQADLILRPMLEELNIYAPEYSTYMSKSFVYRAGNATFNLSLVDARDGTVVAKFRDNRETRDATGFSLERANRATNYRDFRFLMRKWSNEVIDFIDENQIAAL